MIPRLGCTVFISNQKSITLHIFIQSKSKRAKAIALLDSGATENFLSTSYVKKLGLPIWRLTYKRRLFNIDGTLNKVGMLKYYVDVSTRIGSKRNCLWYFLTDLGENQIILRYPWFASAQPRIDWAKGWINYMQLPIVLWSDDADRAIFSARTKKRRVVIKRIQIDKRIPHQYRAFTDVFSDQESKRYLPKRPWDHQIKLKEGAPAMMISKTIPLSITKW